jgi:hypothetical protein
MVSQARTGPFAMHTGTITSWSSDDRCKLIVWMLNRDVAVEVHAGDGIAI